MLIRSALGAADNRRILAMLRANNTGGASAYVVPDGGLLSLTIADSTAIDPISSIGPSGDGWVASVVLKAITSLVGTVDPTKLSISVTDPGFDTSGNATTVSRTITGVAHVRRQYPNGASRMISTDGTDLTLLISLDDWIYSGTTIVSASIASGFYTGSAASTAGTKTNSSTLGYPNPIFGWLNPQNESTGATHGVEAVVFHRHARSGQQVACIKYSVNDGTHTSADVLVSSVALSSRVTSGNRPECWAGTLDMSGMDQGVTCTVNAKIYPWIGTEWNIGTSGVAWPTASPQTKLRVFCDRTGGYGGAYAYVKSGASGGTVSATPATAKADPYPTIVAALAAVKTWNNANKAHNNLGGAFVRLMDDGSGGAQTHNVATAAVNSPGSTWCTIEKDPDTAAVVSITFTAQSAFPTLIKYKNVNHLLGSTTYNILGHNEADSAVCLEGCAIDNTTNKKVIGWYAFKYLLNTTFTGSAADLNALVSATADVALMGGCSGTTTALLAARDIAKVFVGNVMPAQALSGSTAGAGMDGQIVFNNTAYSIEWQKGTTAQTLSYGFAAVQNLCEKAAGAIALNCWADGDLTTIINHLDMHNTAVGERCSRMYNDVVACDVVPNGVVKMGRSMYSIYDNYNFKDDRFSTGAGSVGNWSYGYGVGNTGNVSLFGAIGRDASYAPHNDNADVPYLGSAWLSSSEYNLYRTALGFTQAQIMDMFTNYTVAPRAVPAGGGSYVPLSSATHLKDRVPSGKSVLKYDIAGNLRKTDGTGAAGCYEAAP